MTMKRRDAFRNLPIVIFGLTSVCTVVFANTRVSIFRVATFQNGNIIAINGGITSVLTCFRTCGDTCGSVQYRADDTCVLYSQALLLFEPAAVEGAIQGYRKIVPRVMRYIAVEKGTQSFDRFCFTYDEGQVECEKIGSGLAIVRNQSDYDSLIDTINTTADYPLMRIHANIDFKSSDFNIGRRDKEHPPYAQN